MRQKNQFSWVIIVVTVLAIAGALCWAVGRTQAKLAHPTKDFLTVGTNPPFPPFEQRYGNEIAGFDMDLAEAIAKQLHRRLVIVGFDEFSSVLPALGAGKIDLAASAITVNPERDEVVDFSAPYYTTAQAVLARRAAPLRPVHQANDFTGLKVAYQTGTTSQTWVEKNLLDKVGDVICAPFDDMNYALRSLSLGEFDVILLDKPAAESFARDNPNLKLVGSIETGEKYAFAVQQGDPQHILPTINRVLQEMQAKGEMQGLWTKWFGGVK